MDLVETCPGNIVYLPVFVEGAGLYLGDAHAAMGHGELSASGLEMPAETTITAGGRPARSVFEISDFLPHPVQTRRFRVP